MGWGGQLFAYVKSGQVFKCPSDSTTAGTAGNTVISYAYNSAIPWNNPGDGLGVDSVIARFSATAKTVMLFEVNGFEANVALLNEASASGTLSPSGALALQTGPLNSLSPYEPKPRAVTGGFMATGHSYECQESNCPPIHFNGSNYLLADGHVKWLKPTAVSPGYRATEPTDATRLGSPAGAWAEGTANGTRAATFSPT